MKAAALTMLICQISGAGTAEQAAPIVAKFLRHVEQAGGWPAQSIQGVYRTSEKECVAYQAESQPELVVADLPTYLQQQKAWKLVPLAHMGGATSKRYFVLVREGSYKTLKALASKPVVSTIDAPRFVAQLIMGGKLKAGELALQATARPLKALRDLARGKAEAAVVDETVYAHLGELNLPAKLIVLHQSEPLPGLTLAASGPGARDKPLQQRMAKALPKLCEGPGAELCKTFGVTQFEPAKAQLYRKLARRYR